ncbi:MAG: hypothetical protein CML20_03030 [Rheinheimera sp.]|nr:hypothetical protein [Rheinheimera sp.]|tara:strand:- start:35100 stop:35885 length:786 start_codon:yes stop_codon:yes gene_type:complete
MSTFISDYLVQLENQWKEIDLLIVEAGNSLNRGDTAFYDSLCRSISVLMVAHMEGYLKGVTKCLVGDLNDHLKFKELPAAIQRTHCKKYLGFDQDVLPKYQMVMTEMIDDLSSSDIKISFEPFLFDNNRNPKPESLKIVCCRFGVNDIFANLHESIFDNTFESDVILSRQLRRFEKLVKLATNEFPYRAKVTNFGLMPKKYNGARTLWQSFLDNLNQIRHKIAHGNTFENFDGIADLKRRRDQVKLLKLVVTYVLCAKVCI